MESAHREVYLPALVEESIVAACLGRDAAQFTTDRCNLKVFSAKVH
jgi:hypothetical protein